MTKAISYCTLFNRGKTSIPLAFATVVLLAMALVPCPVHAQEAAGDWIPAGTLNIPKFNYSFLAATPEGDLLAATFFSATADAPPQALPALLIKNPLGTNPKVVKLTETMFSSQRGYGGIACSSSGAFFVSGDTGDPKTCFIRKFNSDGTPDVQFGRSGQILPGRRTLGLEAFGDYLMVAVDWGEIFVLDSKTGSPVGTVPKAPGTVYIRDVTLDPKSMRLFGVAQGGIFTWGGGAPWIAQKYNFRQLTPQVGQLRSGEGISIDPIRRTVLVTPVPGNVIHELHGSGEVKNYVISSANPNAYLTDAVVSFDGTTVFVSDMTGRKIHMLRRDLDSIIAQRAKDTTAQQSTQTTRPTEAVTGEAPPVQWHRSYTAIVREARQQEKPMVVYFRRSGYNRCEEVEKNILLTPDFDRRAQDYTCVFEDVSKDRLLAYRFGVLRIPHLVILDSTGETTAEFTFDIDKEAVFSALQQGKGDQ